MNTHRIAITPLSVRLGLVAKVRSRNAYTIETLAEIARDVAVERAIDARH